jgi:acyl-CoA synthetase (AMP-forming)/AMP-acid ligase II
MATVETDGTIRVLGRGSLSINTGGEKVFPDEVEASIKAQPDVIDVIVVGVPDERFGERVVAVIQARPGNVVSADDIREVCQGMLTGYKIPRLVVNVDQVQRSPSGKPDYPWARQIAMEALSDATTPNVFGRK